MVIYRERRKRDGLEIGSGVRTNRMCAGFIRATDSERRPIRRNGRAARQCVLPSTVREPRHTTRCRLRTERDASIDFSAVCGTVVECTPSNVRRGLPGKTANTVLSWETRLVDTVPSTGFPLGIVRKVRGWCSSAEHRRWNSYVIFQNLSFKDNCFSYVSIFDVRI